MKAKLVTALAALFTMSLAPATQAVVVVGGDNGWEVSFDGNINGFLVYEDADAAPGEVEVAEDAGTVVLNPMRDMMGDPPVGTTVLGTTARDVSLAITGNNTTSSRIRTGLLPGFFSFNVRSPEVGGLRGSARISFAPQIQNANTKNQFGAQIDFREMFFNVDGDFGTWSVGRTLSLHQRHNILTDMTLFGVGVNGIQNGGGTTLGRIGAGYVYPQFNARISYRTLTVNGFQVEVGAYDPSRICGAGRCAPETELPRFEVEATYATAYDGGNVKAWVGGLWQEAEGHPVADKVESNGFHGGLQVDFQGFNLVFSGYTGQGLGTTIMLDTDALDAYGEERDHYGFIAQGTYTFQGRTKVGVSYGESNADETGLDARKFQLADGTDTAYRQNAIVDKQSAFTFGIYHDVNAWLKLVAEYSLVESEWADGADKESDVFTVGSFFLW
jgi:hypothetical protein